MDCLQLAAIFCCVAIGNGNVLKRTLLGPTVCVYGKTADIYSADDVNLLVNGSRYLSHALVNLSAFVNVLSYEFRHVRTGWTRSPSDLGRSFNRCRDIALDVESDGRLTELC